MNQSQFSETEPIPHWEPVYQDSRAGQPNRQPSVLLCTGGSVVPLAAELLQPLSNVARQKIEQAG